MATAAISIDYECPQCQKKLVQDLQQLVPGRKRECCECGLPFQLTDRSLRGLERSLREYCAH